MTTTIKQKNMTNRYANVHQENTETITNKHYVSAKSQRCESKHEKMLKS